MPLELLGIGLRPLLVGVDMRLGVCLCTYMYIHEHAQVCAGMVHLQEPLSVLEKLYKIRII